MTTDVIYLDYNATTPLDPRVLERMMPFLEHEYGNASSRDHPLGWNAADAVEEARFHVAELINAKPSEILFTSGATESINMALKGLAAVAPSPRRQIITSTAEHEAVLGVCRQLAKQLCVDVRYLSVDSCARVSREDLAEALKDRTDCIVALMAANNEIGTIHPIGDLAAIAHTAGALFFSDATQAVGKIPIDVHGIDADLVAFSSHKLYGPKGVGALFIRRREPQVEIEPLIVGGGHERSLRAGTVNVSGIVGFGHACQLARLELEEEGQRIRELRARFEAGIAHVKPGVRINAAAAQRLPGTASILFSGFDAHRLLRSAHSIAASTKSACSSGDSRPSHVLKAIGLSDDDAYSVIRFSLGRFTLSEDIDRAVASIMSSVGRPGDRHDSHPSG
jgi:cysteine desulfurase